MMFGRFFPFDTLLNIQHNTTPHSLITNNTYTYVL